ncbi:Uncharacterised protein [Burkholderia pseudomallei]|nr:Uncharacterised protein [Burkholderia pseudomallei]
MLAQRADRAPPVLRVVGQRESPDLRPPFGRQRLEILRKAGQQIEFRDDHVYREMNAQFLMQLAQAGAQRGCVRGALGRRAPDELLDADRQDHAIDRRARPMFAKQTEKALPLRPVGNCRLFVAGHLVPHVTARRVDQHGLVGEPPFAIGRAAPRALGRCLHLIRERKLQAGTRDRRALARTRRADHHVPRQFIQVAPAFEQAPPAERTAAQALQLTDRLRHRHAHRTDVRLGRRVRLARRRLENALEQCVVRPNRLPQAIETIHGVAEEHRGDDQHADPRGPERAVIAEREERPRVPDQQTQCGDADRAERPAQQPERKERHEKDDDGDPHDDARERPQLVEREQGADEPYGGANKQHRDACEHLPRKDESQEAFQVRHAELLRYSVTAISTRRLRDRPAGVAFSATGCASPRPSERIRSAGVPRWTRICAT